MDTQKFMDQYGEAIRKLDQYEDPNTSLVLIAEKRNPTRNGGMFINPALVGFQNGEDVVLVELGSNGNSGRTWDYRIQKYDKSPYATISGTKPIESFISRNGPTTKYDKVESLKPNSNLTPSRMARNDASFSGMVVIFDNDLEASLENQSLKT